jgi:VCBS repeat-containing protein
MRSVADNARDRNRETGFNRIVVHSIIAAQKIGDFRGDGDGDGDGRYASRLAEIAASRADDIDIVRLKLNVAEAATCMSNVSMQNFAGAAFSDGFVFGAEGADSSAISGTAAFIDAELLFSGNYNRIGVDLVVSRETGSVTVPEYFKGEFRSALMSPDGASLSGRVVEAMTARVQYAQADQIAGAVAAVGNVAKVAGTAVVTRNGVPVELKQGDRLLKGDVVQTGADTTIGISFVDGTALGLGSNARIVLDEMTYDPNGSSNSSLLSLVQGAITLVAGHTAKFGNMRVETPVATMGIRGTAIMVEIAADDGPSKFSVLKEPDGKIGSFQLYDKVTGDLIKVVSQAGLVTVVSPLGAGQPVSAIDQLKTLADMQSEKSLIQQVFQIYYPNYNPDGPGNDRSGSSVNPLANPTTGLALLGSDSGVPALIALANGVVLIPTIAVTQDLLIFPESPATPVVRAIAVADVIDVQASQGPVERNFAISAQVTISVDGQVIGESAGRYVPGTGTVTNIESTVPTPRGINLANLVYIDPATGVVTYDASQFAFLGAGESATYTIGFDSQPGSFIVPETLTLTINGLNDAPVVEHPIPDQRAKEGCRFEYAIPACVFSDVDVNDTLTYRATLANGDPLPRWLNFDPVTMTFSGTPPKGEECEIHIKVIASDEHNATAVDEFDLVIADNHHHHHHHGFDDEVTSRAPASRDHDLVAADAGPNVTGESGDIASNGRGHDNHRPETLKADVASCDERCSRESALARDEGSTLSSRDATSSSSREHASHEVSLNRAHHDGISDTRAHGAASMSDFAEFDADRSGFTDPHKDWSRSVADYSSQTNSSHHGHNSVSISDSVAFSWSSNSGKQRDVWGTDGFFFRSDIGRDTDHAAAPDLTPAGRPWSGDGIDVAALVHVMTSPDVFTAHDAHGILAMPVLPVEFHVHQSDFHLA